MSTRTLTRTSFSFENLMWIFTRVSGLLMFFLVLFGMGAALWMGARMQMDLGTLMRWSFFQNPNHVVNSNIPDVTLGWANAYWQVMEILMVFFGISHGINGLRVVVEDYMGKTWSRLFWRGFLFFLWLFLLVLAVYVILAS